MASDSGHHLTDISRDNHQAWLWVTHFFALTWVAMTAGMRIRIKWRNRSMSDNILIVSHLMYLAYWIVILLALIHSLGKSHDITTPSQIVLASKFVFASRILLLFLLTMSQLSCLWFIKEIFTKEALKGWVRIILALAAFEGVVGCLIISINCSTSRVVFNQAESQCPGNKARWIVLTTMQSAFEVIMLIPVAQIVLSLQTNGKSKLWAMTCFTIRLLISIPIWIHLSQYITFMDRGRTNIDIVPTIVVEEFWACFAVVSVSIPAVMRISKKFSHGGVEIGTATLGSYQNRSATQESRLASMKLRSIQGGSQNHRMALRPDYATNTVNIDASNMKAEGASIGSNAESHVGILRQVDFEVSSDRKGP